MHTPHSSPRHVGSLLWQQRSPHWPPATPAQTEVTHFSKHPSTKQQAVGEQWLKQPTTWLGTALSASVRTLLVAALLMAGLFARPHNAFAIEPNSSASYVIATATLVASNQDLIASQDASHATWSPSNASHTETLASWQSLLGSLCLLLAGAVVIARKLLK